MHLEFSSAKVAAILSRGDELTDVSGTASVLRYIGVID